MATTTVSSKYQVVIPKEVREQIPIEPGQKLAVIVKGGTIHLVPVRPLRELRGIAPNIDMSNIREEVDRL